MSNVIVTKEYMINFLNTKSDADVAKFVGRALVALFRRQLEIEKAGNTTLATNDVGFSKPDAPDGCLGAKSFLKNGTLEAWQVAKWVSQDFRGNPRIVKYSRQLNEIAVANAYRKAKG